MMDFHTWRWKRKSSIKSITGKPEAPSESVGASLCRVASVGSQEKYKKVTISVDTYMHLTGLEDKVQMYENEAKELKEKLFAAYSEINNKCMFEQNVKVCEKALSGWEKASTEVSALKHQLEAVNLSRITADDRVSDLDCCLQDCIRETKNVKEECRKETEHITARLAEVEEETKILKESLATCKSELQASRSMCADVIYRLQSLEAQVMILNQQKSSPESIVVIPVEASLSQQASNPSSIASISGEGTDEEGSSSKTWALEISDFSRLREEKSIDICNKPEEGVKLELKDDFKDMGRSACLLKYADGGQLISSNPNEAGYDDAEAKASVNAAQFGDCLLEQQPCLSESMKQDSSYVKSSTVEVEPTARSLPSMKLWSESSEIFVPQSMDNNMGKFLDDTECAKQEKRGSMSQHLCNLSSGEAYTDDRFFGDKALSQDITKAQGGELLLKEVEQLQSEKEIMSVDLASCIQDLERTQLKLLEKEQLLTELKLELASSQRLYGLAVTQLNCMTDSYRSLEQHSQELEMEIKILRERTTKLHNELIEEKHGHLDAQNRSYNQDKAQRNNCRMSSLTSASDADIMTKQERRIAAVANKIEQCQEAVNLLAGHMQAFHAERLQLIEGLVGDNVHYSLSNTVDNQSSNNLNHARMNSDVLTKESLHHRKSSFIDFDVDSNLLFRSSTSASQPNCILTKSASTSTLEP